MHNPDLPIWCITHLSAFRRFAPLCFLFAAQSHATCIAESLWTYANHHVSSHFPRSQFNHSCICSPKGTKSSRTLMLWFARLKGQICSRSNCLTSIFKQFNAMWKPENSWGNSRNDIVFIIKNIQMPLVLEWSQNILSRKQPTFIAESMVLIVKVLFRRSAYHSQKI